LCVGQELLSYTFWIRLVDCCWPRVDWGRRLPGLADEHSQHLAIPDSGRFERLCLLGDGPAVEVYTLRGGRERGFGLDEALEVLDGARGWQLERQQVVVRRRAGRGDGYGDAGPVGSQRLVSRVWVCGSCRTATVSAKTKTKTHMVGKGDEAAGGGVVTGSLGADAGDSQSRQTKVAPCADVEEGEVLGGWRGGNVWDGFGAGDPRGAIRCTR
jgi:hypothetical protein